MTRHSLVVVGSTCTSTGSLGVKSLLRCVTFGSILDRPPYFQFRFTAHFAASLSQQVYSSVLRSLSSYFLLHTLARLHGLLASLAAVAGCSQATGLFSLINWMPRRTYSLQQLSGCPVSEASCTYGQCALFKDSDEVPIMEFTKPPMHLSTYVSIGTTASVCFVIVVSLSPPLPSSPTSRSWRAAATLKHTVSTSLTAPSHHGELSQCNCLASPICTFSAIAVASTPSSSTLLSTNQTAKLSSPPSRLLHSPLYLSSRRAYCSRHSHRLQFDRCRIQWRSLRCRQLNCWLQTLSFLKLPSPPQCRRLQTRLRRWHCHLIFLLSHRVFEWPPGTRDL